MLNQPLIMVMKSHFDNTLPPNGGFNLLYFYILFTMFYTVVISEYNMFDPTVSPSQIQWTEYFQSLDDAHAFIKLMNNEPPDDDVITDVSLGEPVDFIPVSPCDHRCRYIHHEFITP